MILLNIRRIIRWNMETFLNLQNMLLHLIKLILIFIDTFLGLINWPNVSKFAVNRLYLSKINLRFIFILHLWVLSKLVVFGICIYQCWLRVPILNICQGRVPVLRIIKVSLDLLLVLILFDLNISKNIFIILIIL